MKYFVKIIKESILIVILTSIIGLFTGSLLSLNERILYSFPIILLILPSLNSLTGDICTILVSRLTTHLYIGTIAPRLEKSKRLKEDFLGLLITLLLSLILLIVVGHAIAFYTDIKIINPFFIIIVLFITIILLFVSMFIVLFIGSIFLFKSGKDPNNFLIPFVTSSADFLTPFFLIIFIIIFL